MEKVLSESLSYQNSSMLQDEPRLVYSSPVEGRDASGSVPNPDLDHLYESLEAAGVIRVDELTKLKALLRHGENCYSADRSGPGSLQIKTTHLWGAE